MQISIKCLALAVISFGVFGITVSGVKAQEDKAVITVNGEEIKQSEFVDRLQRVRAQDFVLQTNPPSLRGDSAGVLVVNALINERLILQWATKTNQLPTETQVDAEYDKLKTQPNFATGLEKKLFDPYSVKYDIRWQKSRFNLATTAVSLSPGDGEAFYKAHLNNYSSPEAWYITALRTSKATDIPQLKADLKAGKPIIELLKIYNEDPQLTKNSGVLGPINANEPSIPAQMREALKVMKVGQTSDLIKINADGPPGKPKIPYYWVFQLSRRDPAKVRPFAEVKEQTEQLSLLEHAGGIQVADKKISEYRNLSKISITMAGYDELLPVKK